MTIPFDLESWSRLVLAEDDGLRTMAATVLEERRRQLAARKGELQHAEAELLAALDRVEAARWRLMLATARCEKTARLVAQVKSSLDP
jgi:hypothetical protein